jgi:hypothetical protein
MLDPVVGESSMAGLLLRFLSLVGNECEGPSDWAWRHGQVYKQSQAIRGFVKERLLQQKYGDSGRR